MSGAGTLDSKSAFAQRLKELGLGDVQTEFEKNGWDTFASFAFSSSYTPGGASEAEKACTLVT